MDSAPEVRVRHPTGSLSADAYKYFFIAGSVWGGGKSTQQHCQRYLQS